MSFHNKKSLTALFVFYHVCGIFRGLGEFRNSKLLNTHPLHGEWLGCKSINVTGNIRAVFEEIGENKVEFIAIGSHPELYS